jgi:hypothetical protein
MDKVTKKMATQNAKVIVKSVLRVNIDNEWSIDDFLILFNAINKLYKFYFVLNQIENHFEEKRRHGFMIINPDNMPSLIQELGSFLAGNSVNFHYRRTSEHILEVKQIQFSSPGFTDFAGFGSVLGHFKDILFHFFPDDKTKMETEILKQQRDKLMIENLEKLGIELSVIKQLYLYEEINIANIKSLVDDRIITSIEFIKGEGDIIVKT